MVLLPPPLLVLIACSQQNLPQPKALPTSTPPDVGPVPFVQESQQMVYEFVRRQQMEDDRMNSLIACHQVRAVMEHAGKITRIEVTEV